MLNIYLAGNMTPDAMHYDAWTTKFISVLDGWDGPARSGVANQHLSGRMIVRHDLARLRKSDILVVNLAVEDPRNHLTGMVVEIYEAFRLGIPVYAFTDGYHRSEQADSPWIQEFITHEFQDVEELLHHLQFNENLPG